MIIIFIMRNYIILLFFDEWISFASIRVLNLSEFLPNYKTKKANSSYSRLQFINNYCSRLNTALQFGFNLPLKDWYIYLAAHVLKIKNNFNNFFCTFFLGYIIQVFNRVHLDLLFYDWNKIATLKYIYTGFVKS